MTRQEHDRLFEAYLHDQLSPEEQRALDQRLQSDPDFRREWGLQQDLTTIIGDPNFQRLHRTITEVDQAWSAPAVHAQIRRMSILRIVSVAATVLLLVVVGWFFLSPAPSSTALFAAHFEPYPMVLTARAAPIDAPPELSTALSAYRTGDYTTSAQSFRKLQSATATEEAQLYRLYACVSELGAGNSANSLSCFQTLQQFPQYREQATWYLALAQLHSGDVDAATITLKSIAEGQYQYSAARDLLQSLK